jgi:hypothetical protein
VLPVADCIAATGTFVMVVGCDGWGGGSKRVWGLRMIGCHEGKVGRRCDGRQARFSKEVCGVDEARKEDKTKKF